MSRPNWDTIFMEMCKLVAERSTCVKLKTGTVIVKNRNIISMGYNGVPSGMRHCDQHWKHKCVVESVDYDEFISSDLFLSKLHHEWSMINELHAELNAILQCETSLVGTTLYTLYSPCIQCSKCIIASKIKEVVYLKEYRRDFTKSKEFLESNGVILRQVQLD
jgi:dCMP deaminase